MRQARTAALCLAVVLISGCWDWRPGPLPRPLYPEEEAAVVDATRPIGAQIAQDIRAKLPSLSGTVAILPIRNKRQGLALPLQEMSSTLLAALGDLPLKRKVGLEHLYLSEREWGVWDRFQRAQDRNNPKLREDLEKTFHAEGADYLLVTEVVGMNLTPEKGSLQVNAFLVDMKTPSYVWSGTPIPEFDNPWPWYRRVDPIFAYSGGALAVVLLLFRVFRRKPPPPPPPPDPLEEDRLQREQWVQALDQEKAKLSGTQAELVSLGKTEAIQPMEQVRQDLESLLRTIRSANYTHTRLAEKPTPPKLLDALAGHATSVRTYLDNLVKGVSEVRSRVTAKETDGIALTATQLRRVVQDVRDRFAERDNYLRGTP